MRCKQWIFDMDGTLTDSMTVVWRGAPLALLQRYAQSRPERRAADHGHGRRCPLPHPRIRPALTEAEYYDVMRDVIAQLYETVDLKPGVRTLLAKLQAEGARLCLCSNTWSDQCRTVLTRLGIADYFSFIVEAQGVLHKSRPEVFFECMHRLGGADPAACAVCEDAIYAASTAHKAGFTVLGVQDAASADDACHGAGVRPVPAGLDRTGLDKDLRNFSAKNTPVFPLWEHRRPVIQAVFLLLHCWKASRTAPSRPRGMEMRAPLRMRSSPAESRSASARLTT